VRVLDQGAETRVIERGTGEREGAAVLYDREIFAVWFGAWIGQREESCEERWCTEQRKELRCHVRVPTQVC
jgi:hypothetical protein